MAWFIVGLVAAWLCLAFGYFNFSVAYEGWRGALLLARLAIVVAFVSLFPFIVGVVMVTRTFASPAFVG